MRVICFLFKRQLFLALCSVLNLNRHEVLAMVEPKDWKSEESLVTYYIKYWTNLGKDTDQRSACCIEGVNPSRFSISGH